MAGFDLKSHWYVFYGDLDYETRIKIGTNHIWKYLISSQKALSRTRKFRQVCDNGVKGILSHVPEVYLLSLASRVRLAG